MQAVRVCPKCKSTYASKTQFCGIDGTRLVSREDDPLVGEQLGKYRILERIGRGATGCVYKALHVELGSEFAVKVLLGELGADEEVVGRFRREAKTASQIRAANVVSVMDVGSTDAGLVYLVMEYAQGRPLNNLIKHEAPLDPLRAAKIVRDVAAGLAVAHAKGFVHRDIKPANVFIVDEGGREVAKVLDFGIVRLNQPEEVTKLTQDGQILGTPSYMAPEQWRESEVGPAADLYALGVLLFEMVTGNKPFNAKSMLAIMNMHSNDPPPPLPELGGIENLAMRLLEKQPAKRPPSAQSIVDECEELIALQSMGISSSFTGRRMAEQATVGHRSSSAPPQARRAITEPSGRSLTGSPPPPLPDLAGAEVALASTMGARVQEPSDTNLATHFRRGRSPWPMVGGAMIVVACGIVAFSALRTRSPSVASSALPAAVAAAPTYKALYELERDLAAALSARGLGESDLDGLTSIAAAVATWRKDKTSGDPVKTSASGERLIGVINTAPIPTELLRSKLDRLDKRLAAKVDALGGEPGKALELRYLELYKRIGVAADDASRGTIARDIASLSSSLQ